jgi:hypothetical protein
VTTVLFEPRLGQRKLSWLEIVNSVWLLKRSQRICNGIVVFGLVSTRWSTALQVRLVLLPVTHALAFVVT